MFSQGLLVIRFLMVLCGVEEYVKSGRDQMAIDRNLVMSSTPWSSPSVKYPSYGWGKSTERMPSFTRIHSQVSLLKEKIPDLDKKSRELEWRLFCFENISKK